MNSIIKKILGIFLVVVFIVVNFSVSFLNVQAVDEEAVKDNINKIEDKIEDKQKEAQQLQPIYQQKQNQVYSTTTEIKKTETEISRKVEEIKNLEDKIQLDKKILGEYVRQMYMEDENFPIINFLMKENLSEAYKNFDALAGLKGKVIEKLEEIKATKESVEKVQEELAGKKEEHQELLSVQLTERNRVAGEINEIKLTIAQLQAKLNKLRSTLSSFLGSSFSMDDVLNVVKDASKATGVRKEFLFAMLDIESDLGRFSGSCNYKESKITTRSDNNFKDLIKITEELRYDYKKVKLSCPASSGGTGGAMGVAQFMPSTWMGYKDRIAKKTGNNPPDPWDLEDGIFGMAFKLAAGGATKKSGEHYAAKVYNCGSPSSRYWNTSCESYANTVISWSKGYDDYF